MLLIINLLWPYQAQAEETLYKFIRQPDQTLGYDVSSPVPFYQNATELVSIPETYSQPKNQFQSAWVATINNLNFAQPTSEAAFQENYLSILQTFQEWNMNAMIFQVRPLLDAWYPSEFNPWSEFLSGSQGTDPGYDPLKWMIDVTHEAGMEYHAWFNPYRVTNSKITSATILNKIGLTQEEVLNLTTVEQIEVLAAAGILSEDNYAVQYPEHVLQFDEKFFLNPGVPEVRDYVVRSIQEVVENYDIDAVHFDDYFYPYRLSDTNYFDANGEDMTTFGQYGAGYTDIEVWRRDNVTALVSSVKTMLDTHNATNKTAVQFGVSPFGIWEHKAVDDRGSNTPTSSSKSYSGSIFADTYEWIKAGLLDYVTPQIYWSFDQGAAPYGELVRWWDNVAQGTNTHVYVGHANYKHVNNGGWETAWLNPEEIPNQIKFNQKYSQIKGSTLFSYNDILLSDLSLLDPALQERHQAKNDAIQLLKTDYFNTPTLVPTKSWLSHQEVVAPLDFTQTTDQGQTTLAWKDTLENSTRFFVIYKGKGIAEEVTSNAQNIVTRLWKQTDRVDFSYIDRSVLEEGEHYYITAVDAAGVESAVTELTTPVVETKGMIKVIYQTDTQKILEELLLEGVVGESYVVTSKEFENYELIAQPQDSTGIFTEEEQTLTFTYRLLEQTTKTGRVKVISQTSTQEILAEVIFEGLVGETYEVIPQEFENYELVAQSQANVGVFTEEEQTILLTYDLVKTTIKEVPTTDDTMGTAIKNTTISTTTTQSTGKNLPNTGEIYSYLFILIGSILLLVLLFVELLMKSRRKN